MCCEPEPVVRDIHLNPTIPIHNRNTAHLGMSMFSNVVERLLRHSVKAKFYVVSYLRPTVRYFKLDLDVRTRDLFGRTARVKRRAIQHAQARLMQLVRQIS